MQNVLQSVSRYSPLRIFHAIAITIVLLTSARKATAQEPNFRVGDMVRIFNYVHSYDSADAHHWESWTTTTVYTYGAGITNEMSGLSTWSLLSYNSLGAYANRLNHAMWQWSTNEWTWQNDGFYGPWDSFREIDKDTYVTSLSPLTMQINWQTNNNPRVFNGPAATPDFFNGFKGPVGTISTTNDLGATVTDSYTTTAGLYVPGDPASTNEHFYRVQLSLEYSDHTPIAITWITNYLGQPPDLSSNVYVWLREGQEYTSKPAFSTPSPPSFYSYSAVPNRADQLSTLLISTIRRGPASTWPGTRPDNMAQHMGFPTDEGYFSDDQLALDYILNSPLESNFNALINAALAARGIPIWYEKDHGRGQVGSLSDDERKYMVMLLLARSTNPDPPAELDDPNLNLFLGTNFVYRLVNEFGIEAAGYENKFGHDVAGRHVQRKRAVIGKTKITFEDDVIVRLKIWPGTPAEYILELGFDKADVNDVVAFFAQFLSNDAGSGHNTMQGGLKGSPSVSFICAGRAGETLVDLEQPLLRKMPPDFSCWVKYVVYNMYVNPEVKLSLEPICTWPTFFEYHYDFGLRSYANPTPHPQVDSPFDGFLSLGP